MEKLLIVDGSNLLFQMFYGMPARITGKDGRAIQGTLGFVGALLRILRMTDPTYVAVLFDGETMNERTQIDAAYKANRTNYSEMPEEETPFSQLPDIYTALDCLEICHRETRDCEADDWIAGYAAAYGDRMEMVIVSQDSDFFQLISENVKILRYRGDKTYICDPVYIREKLGIDPAQYAAYKSLTGDPSDNIRGADKIGPKTAAMLMRQFGDLETMFLRREEIAKPSVRRSVAENEERIRKNDRLIRLTGTDILPFTLEELQYHPKGLTTTAVLRSIGIR